MGKIIFFRFKMQYLVIAVTLLSVCSMCNDKEPDTITKDQDGKGGSNTTIPNNATYNGSGTPDILATAGPSRWTGVFNKESGQRYSITGWGGKSIKVYLNYNNGKFYIEYETSVITDNSNSQVKGYFVPFVIGSSTLTIIEDYPILYNSATKTLDFSGKYNGSDVLVGVIALKGSIKANVPIEGAFTECYKNAKIVFDINSYASRMNDDIEIRSLNLSGEKENICNKIIKKIEIKNIND